MLFASSLIALVACTSPALAAVVPRNTYSAAGAVPIPATCKAPGTFANGQPFMTGQPPITANIPDAIYGARDIDLPFGRLYHGNLHFYKSTNDPTKNTATWGSKFDNADQSACGIPSNAFFISGVAIHPYFLRYATMERLCAQDLCISFWREDGKADMMLKVTDICTGDSKDGIPCVTPQDIKIDRSKAGIIMSAGTGHNPIAPQGDTYPDKVWWFFTKCWDDGLVQPAYRDNNNWFADPTLPNNLKWSQQTLMEQYFNNQKNYPAKGWKPYPNGAYNTTRVDGGVDDWTPGQKEPDWAPIAGGRCASLDGAYGTGPSENKPPAGASSSAKAKPTGYGGDAKPKSSSATQEKPKSSSTKHDTSTSEKPYAAPKSSDKPYAAPKSSDKPKTTTKAAAAAATAGADRYGSSSTTSSHGSAATASAEEDDSECEAL